MEKHMVDPSEHHFTSRDSSKSPPSSVEISTSIDQGVTVDINKNAQ